MVQRQERKFSHRQMSEGSAISKPDPTREVVRGTMILALHACFDFHTQTLD